MRNSDAKVAKGNNGSYIPKSGLGKVKVSKVEVEEGEYSFDFKVFTGNGDYSTSVYLPKIKLGEHDSEGKLSWDNWLNLIYTAKDESVAITTPNVNFAIKSIEERYIGLFTQFVSAFIPDVIVNGKLVNKAFIYTKSQMVRCKYMNDQGLYTMYGIRDSEGSWSSEFPEPTVNGTWTNGVVDGKSEGLRLLEEDGDTYFFYPTNLDDLDQADDLAYTENAVNQYLHCFLQSIVAGFDELGGSGKSFNVINSWQQNKKGGWKLKPITNLKSLILSAKSKKISDKVYETILPSNVDKYPEFTKFFYGGILGLSTNILNVKIGEDWVCRYQMPFSGKPLSLEIEGLDLLVTNRNPKYNPLLIMDAPVIELTEQEQQEELELVAEDNNEPEWLRG